MTSPPSREPSVPASWGHPRYRIVDRDVALSRSSLWSMSTQWYAEHGPEAWRMAGVPWYITSNSAIAQTYAEVALGVIRDVMAAQPDRPGDQRRLEILEVCGGLGQFAYLFLARLLPLLAESAHADWTVHYMLTDGAQANVEAWETHPSFRRLRAGGILDVAVLDAASLDAESLGPINLRRPDGPVAHFRGPLLLVANYAYDSLPADLFRVEGDTLLERPVTIGVPHATRLAPGVTAAMVTFGERPAAIGHGSAFDDAEFRAVLEQYAATLPPGDFLFPTAGLRLLRHLDAMVDGAVVGLVADRACISAEELGGGAGARIDLQGGPTWATVNIDAVSRWVEGRGGVAMVRPSLAGNLAFSVFALGDPGDPGHPPADPDNSPANPDNSPRDPDNSPRPAAGWLETHRAFSAGLTPDDLFSIQKQFDAGVPGSLEAVQLVAYLELFGWDPDLFVRFAPRLLEDADKLGDRLRRSLERGAPRVWSLYFPTGHSDEVPLLLARLMACLDRLDLACAWFQAAINLRGAEPSVLLELGACLWRNDQRAEARAAVNAALALDPNDEEARALALRLDEEPGT